MNRASTKHVFARGRIVLALVVVALCAAPHGSAQGLVRCSSIPLMPTQVGTSLSIDLNKGTLQLVESPDDEIHVSCPAVQGKAEKVAVSVAGSDQRYEVHAAAGQSNVVVVVAVPKKIAVKMHVSVGRCRVATLSNDVVAHVGLGDVYVKAGDSRTTRNAKTISDAAPEATTRGLRTYEAKTEAGAKIKASVTAGYIVVE